MRDPRLSISPVGRYRFTARVEVPLVTSGRHAAASACTVATLVLIGPLAERAYAQFTEGDRFLAEGGWVLLGTSGEERGGVEFFARHLGHDRVPVLGEVVAEVSGEELGHDLAQHRYAVDRTRRRGWQPHAPAHPLTIDWAAPLLTPVAGGGSAAS